MFYCTMYIPVSFLKFLTIVLKNLFGTRSSGEISFALHDGQICSSVASSAFRIPTIQIKFENFKVQI